MGEKRDEVNKDSDTFKVKFDDDTWDGRSGDFYNLKYELNKENHSLKQKIKTDYIQLCHIKYISINTNELFFTTFWTHIGTIFIKHN